MILKQKFLDYDYEFRFITEADDLMPLVSKILMKLLTDSDSKYSNLLKEIISEL